MGIAGAQPIRCAITVLDYSSYFPFLKYFVYLLHPISYPYMYCIAHVQPSVDPTKHANNVAARAAFNNQRNRNLRTQSDLSLPGPGVQRVARKQRTFALVLYSTSNKSHQVLQQLDARVVACWLCAGSYEPSDHLAHRAARVFDSSFKSPEGRIFDRLDNRVRVSSVRRVSNALE